MDLETGRTKMPDVRTVDAQSTIGLMRGMSFADCEMAWSSLDRPARMIRYPWSGAALQMDRKFVGIEIEERWFAAAERRIEHELDQGRLL
jgi:hypothetical protein